MRWAKIILLNISIAYIISVFAQPAINPQTVSRSVPTPVVFTPNVINPPFLLQTVSPYGNQATTPAQINGNDASDFEIASNVQSQIAQNGNFAGSSITVICQGGIVTLLGTVPVFARVSLAIKIASGVPGVKGVNSKLSVSNGTGYQ